MTNNKQGIKCMTYKARHIGCDFYKWFSMILKTELPTHSKMVAACLNNYMNPKNMVAWPSLARIAKDCSTTKATVIKHIQTLELEGWVTIHRGGCHDGQNISNRYLISFPADAVASIKPGAVITEPPEGGIGAIPHGVQELYPGGIGAIPELSIEQTKEKRESGQAATTSQTVIKKPRKKRPIINPLDLPIPDEVDHASWVKWVEHKATTKKPINTQGVITEFINQLKKHSPAGQAAMVSYSMKGGYPALYDNQGDDAIKKPTTTASHYI